MAEESQVSSKLHSSALRNVVGGYISSAAHGKPTCKTENQLPKLLCWLGLLLEETSDKALLVVGRR